MTRAQFGSGAQHAPGPRSRPAAPPSRTAVMTAWRRHQDLLRSATSLVATTGVASVLGFLYWAFAARLFSQQAVGYGSAAVSAMTLLGTIGMLGLGTVLIGELPRRPDRARLISAALLASGTGSLVLGLVFAVAAPHLDGHFGHISGTLGSAALFAAGGSLTGATLVSRPGHHRPSARGPAAVTQHNLRRSQAAGLPVAAVVLRPVRHWHHRLLGGRHRAVDGAGRPPAAVWRHDHPAAP